MNLYSPHDLFSKLFFNLFSKLFFCTLIALFSILAQAQNQKNNDVNEINNKKINNSAQSAQPQMQLKRGFVSAGFHQIEVQIAQKPEERQIGLMHRKSMPINEGMLFIFEEANVQCFWMKNTHLPLTTAFIADDGKIVNLVDMKPFSLDSHCSQKPVRYVLEMNQGWFSKKGISANSILKSALFNNQ